MRLRKILVLEKPRIWIFKPKVKFLGSRESYYVLKFK
jgi:hypothetical protein